MITFSRLAAHPLVIGTFGFVTTSLLLWGHVGAAVA